MKYKIFTNTIFIFISLGLCLNAAADGTISSMQVIDKNPNFTVSMYVRGNPSCKSFKLSKPSRIVVDCKNTVLLSKPTSNLWRNTPVARFRSSVSNSKLRMVWELKQAEKYNFSSKVDFFGKRKLILTLGDNFASQPVVVSAKSINKANNIFNGIQAKWPRNTIIVIDPGHGGKDPGATGVNNIHEKNVVLAISRHICANINRQPGFKAYLTRDKDVFLSLRQRLRVARARHADMFVAIHADAFNNNRAHGASVFALSLRGATSEAARWIAERENQSELIGGVDLADKDKLLRSVLIDLSQSATIRTSLEIGKGVINDLKSIANIHHNTVEQAAFVVLKSPDIPSLLIETGFLSNKKEARQLNSRVYQRKMAKAISAGIMSYFKLRPLPNTWLALRKRSKTISYKVRSGDSLSEIAQQFSVAINSIKQVNRMTDSQIRIGQNLLIPSPSQ